MRRFLIWSKTSKIHLLKLEIIKHKCHNDTAMSSFWFYKDIYFTDRLYIPKREVCKLFNGRVTYWNPSISRIHFSIFSVIFWFRSTGKREKYLLSFKKCRNFTTKQLRKLRKNQKSKIIKITEIKNQKTPKKIKISQNQSSNFFCFALIHVRRRSKKICICAFRPTKILG